MTCDKVIKKLEKDEEFKKWKKENSDSYLAHVFVIGEDINNSDIGYYNNDDTITTFELRGNNVTLKAKEKIFKHDEKKVKELDITKASLTFDQIKDIAEEFREKNYKNEISNKNIFILQHLDKGIIWNITLVTLSFNTLNMKIDAATGEVIYHKLHSLMQMGNFVK